MSSRELEIQFEDPNPQKWCEPLKEDVFAKLPRSCEIHKPGSLFSPWLFGKFFDPSDAFPLWEFEPDELLPPPASAHRPAVHWHQTDHHFLLRAEISGHGNVEVLVEKNGKILEICGQEKESKNRNWKSRQWWEHGFVRRIELGEQTDWRKSQAFLTNDASLLEIKIPKIPPLTTQDN